MNDIKKKHDNRIKLLQARYPDYVCSVCGDKFPHVDTDTGAVLPKTDYLRRFVVIVNGDRLSHSNVCAQCRKNGEETAKRIFNEIIG